MRPLLAALLPVVALVGCSDADADGGTTTTVDDIPPPLQDGTWFAFVTVGEDEAGAMTLGIDLADMLTGDEAVQAAIEDGAIAEGDLLPNDFYVDNDDVVIELLHASDGAIFTMISGQDTAVGVDVDSGTFGEILRGTYTGEPLYGVVADSPIAMEVEVADGFVTGATAVYLP
jgi:hypothetical protein